jgi:hypothetical protein
LLHVCNPAYGRVEFGNGLLLKTCLITTTVD